MSDRDYTIIFARNTGWSSGFVASKRQRDNSNDQAKKGNSDLRTTHHPCILFLARFFLRAHVCEHSSLSLVCVWLWMPNLPIDVVLNFPSFILTRILWLNQEKVASVPPFFRTVLCKSEAQTQTTTKEKVKFHNHIVSAVQTRTPWHKLQGMLMRFYVVCTTLLVKLLCSRNKTDCKDPSPTISYESSHWLTRQDKELCWQFR